LKQEHNMLYPVYIHMGDAKHAHGVTFPDFPGCFSAADEWSDLPGAIQEAVEAHFHGEPDAQYQGGVWLLAEIDLTRIDTRPVRLNVSLPSNLVQQIDTWASEHHMTRSGFLAKAAVEAMRERA
jgi:predicted RNase H-like HicB family nuclease